MNNEPVAWGNQNTFCKYCHRIPSQCCCSSVKELTDEEIMSEWEESKDEVEFARAILRKTQEK